MSRIAGKNTAPEMLVRRYLHGLGYRYTLHKKDLPGKPDIVLTRFKTIINIHGCFWHGHEHCKYFSLPKTRTMWWWDKINGNRLNDEKVEKLLKKAGWNIITVWGCQLKTKTVEKTLEKLAIKLEKLRGKS